MSAVTKSSFPRRTCRSWPGPSGKPRKEPSPRHQRSSDALLVGVGRCAACGYPLSHSSGGARGYTKLPLSCPPRGRPVSYPARISLRRADVYVEQALLHWAACIRLDAIYVRRSNIRGKAVFSARPTSSGTATP